MKPLFTSLVLSSLLFISGCLLVGYPLSYGSAAMNDRWWSPSGEVVGESGQPIKVSVNASSGLTPAWVPGTLEMDTRGKPTQKTAVATDKFAFQLYGAGVHLKFTQPGFWDEELIWGSYEPDLQKEVTRLKAMGWGISGTKTSPQFRVVMIRREERADLIYYNDTCTFSAAQADECVMPLDSDGYGPAKPRPPGENNGEFGTLVFHLERIGEATTLPAIETSGATTNPGTTVHGLKISLVGATGGLLRANLPEPQQIGKCLQRAPQEGYHSDLRLDEGELKALVPIRPLSFYIKSGGRYGRATILWFRTIIPEGAEIEIVLNKKAGDTAIQAY